MKIAICGSMYFAQDMISTKDKLENFGHEVILPQNTEQYAKGDFKSENKWEKLVDDVIKKYYEEIKKCDAVLVINNTKNNIDNYIGGNALIEMAFAYVSDKKIFLLNPIPDMSYKDEMEAMKPVVLDNDFSKVA